MSEAIKRELTPAEVIQSQIGSHESKEESWHNVALFSIFAAGAILTVIASSGRTDRELPIEPFLLVVPETACVGVAVISLNKASSESRKAAALKGALASAQLLATSIELPGNPK